MIATGGEAQYFPPAEEFLVRRSRLVFSLLTWFWSSRSLLFFSVWRRPGSGGSTGKKRTLILAVIALLGLAVINGYVFIKLLPAQNTSLPVLIRFATDSGFLMTLLLLLSLAWVVACAMLLIHARLRQLIVPLSG